jgi:hypothetical protein
MEIDYDYIWSQVQFKLQRDIDPIMKANKISMYFFFQSERDFFCMKGNYEAIAFYMDPWTHACTRMRVINENLLFGR